MKAIVLAAGEGTRLKPLTDSIPKVLVEVAGKTLLEHNLDTIYRFVDEILIVVKYKADLIKEKIGEYYKWVKVTYITQGEEKGTGAAVKWIRRKWDIVLLYADAIVHPKDVQKVIKSKKFAILWKKVKNPEKYGVLEVSKKGHLKRIVEKPKEFVGDFVSFGFYKVNEKIFDYVEKLKVSPRGELELTDAINTFADKHEMKVLKIKHPLYDITTKEDVEKTTKIFLKENKKYKISILTKKDFMKYFDSFVDTLESLKPTGDTSKKKLKKFFELSEKQGPTFVAINKDKEIIGTLKVLLEAKLLRGGQFAAKFEDISVRKGYQGLWIWSELIKKALAFCEKKEVYKITLSCREEILSFYEKFGFVRYSTNMKKYMTPKK